jgi:hypothetical protein
LSEDPHCNPNLLTQPLLDTTGGVEKVFRSCNSIQCTNPNAMARMVQRNRGHRIKPVRNKIPRNRILRDTIPRHKDLRENTLRSTKVARNKFINNSTGK